jgi:hypothetical protein
VGQHQTDVGRFFPAKSSRDRQAVPTSRISNRFSPGDTKNASMKHASSDRSIPRDNSEDICNWNGIHRVSETERSR